MAAVAQRRTSAAGLASKSDNHKLLPDTYQNTNTARRHSEQSPSADGVASERTTGETGAPGSNHSASDTTTDANDDDGTAGPTDDHEDDDEEPEVSAPSRGYGKGKGKRPSIRFEAAGDDESASDDDETASREAGLTSSKHPVAQLRNSKKRTYSNLSNSSLLFGEESAFPRPKALRTLSHTADTGLLTYHGADADGSRGDDNAIESSDDEGDNLATTEDDDEDYSALNQILDDDTDVEKVEEEEESFILHQETNNGADIFTMPFSPDLRRSSIDTLGSGDLFDFSQGIATDGNGSFFTSVGLPDAGFGQFFSEAAPASPEPIAKRKFSADSSTKRVRFQDHPDVSDSSDSSESELDDTLFPDLFLEQDKLPRSVHQLMEIDDSHSGEDFDDGASDQFFYNGDLKYDDFDDESEAGSSGYESMVHCCRKLFSTLTFSFSR